MQVTGNIQVKETDYKPTTKQTETKTETKGVSLSKDQVNTSEIKRGIVPFFSGAGKGFMPAAVIAAVSAGVGVVKFAPEAIIPFIIFGPVAGFVGGGLAGSVISGTTANITDNKWKAAGIGAAAGAVIGLASAKGETRFFGAAVGALIVGVSTYIGASDAEKK